MTDAQLSGRVRRLMPSDAERMAIAVRQLKPEVQHLPQTPRACQAFLDDVRSAFFLAEANAEPVGYAVAYILPRVDRASSMVLLYEVEVHSQHRQQGVGRRLVQAVKQLACREGACKMWTLTDQQNHPARQLYRCAGGAEVEENLLIAWSEENWATGD